ncbi:MAG: M13 family metallopeptidase [Candidatus Amulumruptor caecigallinarius]|nr:M13 family metallopeptidase [Candidatus Amulumruptor caecigallinarius]
MRIRTGLTMAFCAAMGMSTTALLAQEHLKSLSKEGIDANISPKEDFYGHVNKKWMESHPLTPEYARYGQFNILNDSSEHRVQRIVRGLSATNPEKGTNAFKIATLYEQGMDSVRRNREGAAPIKATLEKIENTDAAGMADLFRWMHRYQSSPLFSVGFMEDLANSKVYSMYVNGGGLGLGDRDYYLLNDKRNKEVRDAYVKLIETQMNLAGYSKKDAKRIAKNVMKIETLLADSVWTREQSRNIPAMYNPRTLAQVTEMYPNLPVKEMIEDLGITPPEMVIVTQLNTVQQADNLMKTLTDREKKDYYLWDIVSGAAPFLSDDFANASFAFNKVMSGVQQQRPRWKKALSTVEGSLGEGIGQLYVEKYFPESSKIYMEGLVENLRNALGKHIINLPWMTDDTKVAALKKLNSITVKIGYPDKWKDYSLLVIEPEKSYYDNIYATRMWEQDRYLEKWGKPVDRTEWSMTPQTINAYYNPINNEIVFPAGILQAPFFDPESSDAENYGGIGVVIGHELTHGFDDQGCNFDFEGNMKNWWTAEDKEAFDKLTKGLADQYSEIEVLPGLHANGAYTLGENIADQGGLRISYTAFLDSQKKKGVDVTSDEAKIEGFDPTQVFYMNFANLWANNIREAEIRNLTTADPHSLGVNRVNVSLRNIEPFMKAFGVTEGNKMFRPVEERVIIW